MQAHFEAVDLRDLTKAYLQIGLESKGSYDVYVSSGAGSRVLTALFACLRGWLID